MRTLGFVGKFATLAVAMAGVVGARPVPNGAQLDRATEGHEIIGIVHWGLNTFYDREWGNGDEDPAKLNPSDFNADQIVAACKAGGISALTVVAKHHDGFCLWPTKTTGHNITKSPFRGGRGDYVKEMSDACRRAGLRFGVYCSPWDRNNAEYARPAYVETFHKQVRELTDGRYGPIFLMWFDGANGGDGWYGGARETRKIPKGYYRYDQLIDAVRRAQPGVGIFGGAGRGDFRWPGNEKGELCDNSRATTGAAFRPAECDFPLRPGWFYHESERGKVRHAAFLMKIYLRTVGNAGSMEIGIAPDRRGQLDDEDVRALAGFSRLREAFFAHEVTKAGEPFNVVVMREDISAGEQVDGWEFRADGKTILTGEAIGSKRIRTLPKPIAATNCDVVITKKGPAFRSVSCRRYYVDPELERIVREATSECGETDTAKWMKAAAGTEPKAPDVTRWHGANLLGLFNAAPPKPDKRIRGKFEECYFRWFRDWGFNFARLPMDYRYLLATNDWTQLKEDGFKRVDEAVAWGRKYGVHVQLCLHRAPGFTITSWIPEATHLQTDAAPQAAFIRIWREFARRYRGIPNDALSFNLINEPAGFSEAQFIDIFGRTIEAIREEDPGRFVMLDGNHVASTPVPHFYKVPLTGQAFRGYTPHAISHYGAWYIKDQPKVEPTWPFSPEMTARDEWIYELPEKTFAKYGEPRKIGYPVMVGEFGCYNQLKHETCLKWMEHCLKIWQRNGLGWAIWNVDGPFGFMDSGRADVEYENFEGHKLDRKMLDLLLRYSK